MCVVFVLYCSVESVNAQGHGKLITGSIRPPSIYRHLTVENAG